MDKTSSSKTLSSKRCPSNMYCALIVLADGVNDQQPCSGLQRGLFRRWQEVQARTLAAWARHNKPLRPRPLRYWEEDVHWPATGRAAAAASHVLGKFIQDNVTSDMNSASTVVKFALADWCHFSYSWSEILRSLQQITSHSMWSIRDFWFPTENFLSPSLRDDVRRRA